MKNILRKGITLLAILTMGFSTLTGCGQKSEDASVTAKETEETSAPAKEAEDTSKVQKVVIGSGTNYNPYCYLDENGKATGYEYALLQEIDNLLPEYEFEYQSMNFDSLLLSLESGKIDVAAHQYEYTDERAEKYLFGEEAYTSYVTYLAVLTDDNTTQSLEDLAGQKVRTGGTTSATTTIVNNYNEEHPDKAVEIVATDGSTDEEGAAAIKSGAAKALVLTKRDVEKYNKNFGEGKDFLKVVGEPINDSKTYYLYRKDETQLQQAIDGALKELKESGKLAELSIQYIGGDFTESE